MQENNAIVQTSSTGIGITRPTIQSGDMINTGWRIAEYAARSSLVKSSNAYDCFFIIQYGWELGLTPMAALRTIYSVNGVPTCSGEAMLALIRRSGLCSKLEISGDNKEAIVIMSRKDTNETYKATFTIQDAQRAGLAGKDVWKKYPSKMLKWRAVSECAKFLFGDIIGGLYTVEEIAPDLDLNESGDIIGDIILDDSHTTPSKKKPDATKIERPDFGKQSSTTETDGSSDEGEETPKWFEVDNGKNLNKIVKWARDEGMTEETDNAKAAKELLTLAQAESWADFETGAIAWKKLTAEHENQLEELANRNEDKSQPEAPAATNDEPETEADTTDEQTSDEPITLSDKDKTMLADFIEANFAGRTFGEVCKELESDFSEFTTLDSARSHVIKTAEEKCWPIITNMISHKDAGKTSYIELHSVVDEIRIYSRNKLVTMLGTDFPKADDIKNLPVGGSLILEDNIAVTYEAKGHYNSVTAAVKAEDFIPF